MTARQLNGFRAVLQDKQAELLRELRINRARLAISECGDSMERLRNRAERDITIRRVNLAAASLQRVRGALREIVAGTYGCCAECDGAIPLPRLRAVPWSPYCIACQETAESREQPADLPLAG